MENKDIRAAIADAGLRMWQVAEALNIADTTFCRKLRRELSDKDKQRVFSAIAELTKEAER